MKNKLGGEPETSLSIGGKNEASGDFLPRLMLPTLVQVTLPVWEGKKIKKKKKMTQKNLACPPGTYSQQTRLL